MPNKGDMRQLNPSNHSICDKFDRLPFPVGSFCPPQKDEFAKRICNKKCMECPFFGWPMPGPPGRDGIDGKDGTDGTNGINGTDGANGTNGTDGITPTIGANGNWWIGETDTGVPARGQDGTNGVNGADGTNGTNGTNGITPTIGANGNWWIGETDTGVPARGQDGTNGVNGADGVDGANGTNGITPTIGANGNWWTGETDTGLPARGPQGPAGTFSASSLFVWKSDQQTLAPAATAGGIGDAVAFTGSVVGGEALSFTSPAHINILQPGYYSIRWEIYKSGYDSAFGLFFDPDGGGATLLPGSNYGGLSHDERYSGQAIAVLTAGGTLTLNCISTIYPQEIQNQISDDVLVTGASIVIIKIS